MFQTAHREQVTFAFLLSTLACFFFASISQVQAGMFDATIWNLTGTGTARIGRVTQTVAIAGTLTLNANRTYLLDDNDPNTTDETGVWFENRDGLLLFSQNLLEQILELESEISMDAGEPVRANLVRSSFQASFNTRTGLLTLQQRTQFNLILLNSNFVIPLSFRLAAAGTQMP